jgi:hypothetical protein
MLGVQSAVFSYLLELGDFCGLLAPARHADPVIQAVQAQRSGTI